MERLVSRPETFGAVTAALKGAPVVLLVGPRQCGKTTLARQVSEHRRGTWFDLEDSATPLRAEAAKAVLAPLKGLIVIDEFQHQPKLFELLRVLADRRPLPARFLVLGSASPSLVRGSSESLAGRVVTCEMSGFNCAEVEASRQTALWIRGGFPRSFLARTDRESAAWRAEFVKTFLERDLPQLGLRLPAPTLRRFWTMLAHFHGQVWNGAELARSIGAGENSVRHYLDVLTGAFMVRQLSPWFVNIGKRLVKSPKIYFRDSGLLHSLLSLETRMQVLSHPKLGASWEGFALEQALRVTETPDHEAFFYRTQAGAELDLLIVRRGRAFGFEFKHEDAPRFTKSMQVALEDLKLEHLFVVCPGSVTYEIRKQVTVVGLSELATVLGRSKLAVAKRKRPTEAASG